MRGVDHCAVSSSSPRLRCSSSLLACAPASAIPIFAQRYHLRCGQCHSVLPGAQRVRKLLSLARLPAAAARARHDGLCDSLSDGIRRTSRSRLARIQPGGIVLGSGNIGPITLFLHYNLGAGGGPSATYPCCLRRDTTRTRRRSIRGGLFELPLAQSPGQRLDDLQQYGYYGAHVGLNNLPLSSPRWGIMGERTFGKLTRRRHRGVRFLSRLGVRRQTDRHGRDDVELRSRSSALWLRQTLVQEPARRGRHRRHRAGRNARRLADGAPALRRPLQRYGLLAHATLRQSRLSGRAMVRRRSRRRRIPDESALFGRLRAPEILSDPARVFRRPLRRVRQSVHQSRLRLLRSRSDRAVPRADARGAVAGTASVPQRRADGRFPRAR